MVAVCCLVANSFRILVVVDNRKSIQNVFLCIGSWHVGMGLGWEVLRGSKWGRKAGCSTSIYLVPWERGERMREAATGGRLQSWEGDRGAEETERDLKSSQATCFLDGSGLWVSRECLLELAAGIKWCVRGERMEFGEEMCVSFRRLHGVGLHYDKWLSTSKNSLYIKLW